jgi:serine/threonine-protein kinase
MYIVMEFVSGPSLESWFKDGTLGVERVVALIGQIAAGLDAAHARGLVHRDIKPSNILLTRDGVAKIADFGITQVASSALTQDLTSLGTPAYMSPEQIKGKALTSRADLFSLGVVAYEILAGRKPFEGVDLVSMAHAIATTHPVPISEANPDLPQSLDPVLEKILAKEPSERFANGQEFFEALRASLSGEPADSPTPRVAVAAVASRSRMFWTLAAIALLVTVVATLPRGKNAQLAAATVGVARIGSESGRGTAAAERQSAGFAATAARDRALQESTNGAACQEKADAVDRACVLDTFCRLRRRTSPRNPSYPRRL